MKFRSCLFHVEEREMLHKQRVLEEGRQELIFKNQRITICNMSCIPIPYFTGLGEEHIAGNCFTYLIINRESPLSFRNKSNIIISQRMRSPFSQKPLHVFQFHDIH